MNIKVIFYIVIYSIFGLSGSGIVMAQVHNVGEFDPQKRSMWIEQEVNDLKLYKPEEDAKSIKLKTINKKGEVWRSVRVVKKGLVELDKGDWIFIVTNSGHDNPSVGDISLAIDQNGKIYRHSGHVCGNIIHFEAVLTKPHINSKLFFRNFKDDTEGLSWEKLK